MATTSKTEDRIVAAATSLFLRYGYSRVVIDDIAQALSMSKKTIYNHFASKAAILLACIDAFADTYRQEAARILNDVDLTLRQKFTLYLQHIGESLSAVNQSFRLDLKRNEPQAWERMNAYIRDISLLHLTQLVEEGVRVGYLRDDANHQLGILVYIAALQQLTDADFLAQFPSTYTEGVGAGAQRQSDQILQLLLRGLLSPKYKE